MRSWAGQALLALLLTVSSFWGIVDAQAYFGTVGRERFFCGSDNFYYLGCFPTFETSAGNTYFPFDSTSYSPAHPVRNFPGWDPGTNYNSTVTPLDCARVCRGFGYKFSALRDNNCKCGLQLPLGYLPGADANCDVPCGGDNSQTCGGGSSAQIYLDPTFAANIQVPIPVPGLETAGNPTLGIYYQYLGCYYTPDGFPTQDSRATILLTSGGMQGCLNYCAGLGYPMAYGFAENGNTRCNCGTSMGSNAFRTRAEYLQEPGVCNSTCTGSAFGNCDVGAERCCGRNNYAPIYLNSELQGCYSPRLPGYKATEFDATYECYDPLTTVFGPPRILPTAVVNPAMLLTRGPALLKPPQVSSPGGTIYYLFACFGSPSFNGPGVNGVLNALTSATYLNISPATLERCAELCSAGGYPVFGMTNGRDCSCSSAVVSSSTDSMRSCRIACGGASAVACGASNGPVVYSAQQAGVYLSYQATVLATPYPTYICTGRTASTTTTVTTLTTTSTSLSTETSTTSTTATDSFTTTSTSTTAAALAA
ncbi:WSC domain-containing protein 1, partial [Cladorrhinum sp. PSN259]